MFGNISLRGNNINTNTLKCGRIHRFGVCSFRRPFRMSKLIGGRKYRYILSKSRLDYLSSRMIVYLGTYVSPFILF